MIKKRNHLKRFFQMKSSNRVVSTALVGEGDERTSSCTSGRIAENCHILELTERSEQVAKFRFSVLFGQHTHEQLSICVFEKGEGKDGYSSELELVTI
jgi:hypothetical protein